MLGGVLAIGVLVLAVRAWRSRGGSRGSSMGRLWRTRKASLANWDEIGEDLELEMELELLGNRREEGWLYANGYRDTSRKLR